MTKLLALSLVAGCAVFTALPSLSAEDLATAEVAIAEIRRIVAAHPTVASVEVVGASRGGREILAVTVAAAPSGSGARPPGERPALLVTAGLDEPVPFASQQAVAILSEILRRAEEPEARSVLAAHTLYFLPLLHPDAVAARLTSPSWERTRNGVPRDDDRDQRIDEDGPDDLDGDGQILSLRVPDPDGPLVVDAADPRILRPFEPGDRGSARFRRIFEGIDNDGDGAINEDPPGGADPARNFPYDFEPRASESGAFPASEPETKALLDFLLSHANVEAAVHFGGDDNLVQLPRSRDERPAARGEHRVWKDDAELYTQAAALHKERTGRTIAGRSETRGDWPETAYFLFGVPCFAVCVLGPEPPGSTAGGSGGARELEKRWLDWNDGEGQGAAFVPWKPFHHPQLGDVHLGGWKPYAKLTASPAVAVQRAAGETGFILELARRLSDVGIEDIRLLDLGGGLYEARARVTNRGELPTALRQGVFTGRRSPLTVEVLSEGLRAVGENPRRRIEVLAGRGGSAELKWLFLGAPGSQLTMEVRRRGQRLATRSLPIAAGGTL